MRRPCAGRWFHRWRITGRVAAFTFRYRCSRCGAGKVVCIP